MKINSKKISILVVILFLFLVGIFINIFGIFEKGEVEAVSKIEEDTELYINQNPVDIDTILYENVESNVTKEMIVEDIDLEYTTVYTENENLPSGTLHVTQVRY